MRKLLLVTSLLVLPVMASAQPLSNCGPAVGIKSLTFPTAGLCQPVCTEIYRMDHELMFIAGFLGFPAQARRNGSAPSHTILGRSARPE